MPNRSCRGWDSPLMNAALPARSQLSAIAELRWRMFMNGLRTKRAKLELASRVVVTSVFVVGGLGAFGGAALTSGLLASHDKFEYLAILMWLVFFFWQLFPLAATAFTNNPDSSDLLRFPLTYRAYFLIRLAYGYCDPASGLGSVGLLGLLVGVTVARPLLFPWTLLVVLTFALFNLVLMQTVFAWLERWLAQRRTREILGVLFILLMLSLQLIGPTIQHFEKGPQPELERAFEIAGQIQAFLPPGLAAGAIAQAAHASFTAALASMLALAMVALAIGCLLHVRLRAQFRGENLSEAGARPTTRQTQPLQVGWSIPGTPSAVAAVFEKEIRYLARSGPVLLSLIMPIFMLVVFRFGPLNPAKLAHTASRTPDMAFPGAAAYAILVLTNIVYNSFGGDAGGVQFFYASPVTFSQIVLGKNLMHAGIVLANTALAWLTVAYFYGPPAFAVTVATIAGLLFAVPLNFTAGNLLSVTSPKRRDFATFGRQNVSQLTVLASLGLQAVIVGVGIAAFTIARLYKDLWIATAIFLVLAAMTIPLYIVILRRLDRIAIERRETMLAELCRA